MRNERSILSWLWPSRGSVIVLVALAGLLIGAVLVRWSGSTYTQPLMTLVVVGIGGLLARRNLAAKHHFPVAVRINLATTVVWQACSILLIWTSLRSELLLWQASWIALIVVLGSTHLLALRVAAFGRSGPVKGLAFGSVVVLALMLLYPAVTPGFPSLPSASYLWVITVPAASTVLGSIAVWRTRSNSGRRAVGESCPAGVQWVSLSQLALIVIGLCIGRATAPQREAPEVRPSVLADLTHEELAAQLDADLGRLKILDSEVTDLVHQMEALRREFDARFRAEQRDYYLPHEGTQMRTHFRRFLACRASLLRIVAGYAGLDELPDPRMRARCFTLGFAAAMRTYESSVRIILTYREHILARRTLNESQQQHGVDEGMFDWVYESVTSEYNVNLASRMADRFMRHRTEWRDAQVWQPADWDWLDTHIVTALDYVREHPIDHWSASLDLFLRRLGDQAYAPLYEVQSALAEWMGDTRVVDQPPAIHGQQIKRIESELRPGDILLQRREWYMANAFLPGFWSHAALYVGRIEDLRRLGIADHPTVQAHLTAYLASASDGSDRTVIEALSEGVVFNSSAESLHADHVAVLRPNLSERQIAQAIVNAFEYHGRPYDFEFDFATADKLVCTEVVYRAYQGMLRFDLVRIMGRNTLPAADIARKFARERHDPHHELDLLLYYETPLSRASAQRSTEQAFVATVAS
jgi:hypothetical protein